MTSRSDQSRARTIAVQLAAITHAYLDCKATDEALVKRLRKLADRIEATSQTQDPLVSKLRAEEEAVRPLVRRIFDYWQLRMGKPRAKLTKGRVRVIGARNRDGYTEAQLRQAIDACAASDFHMGDNERMQAYNDLTLIFRNGEKLEQFLEMRSTQDPTQNESTEVQRLQREAQEALARGDTDAFNAANTRIRDRRAAAEQSGRAADPGG